MESGATSTSESYSTSVSVSDSTSVENIKSDSISMSESTSLATSEFDSKYEAGSTSLSEAQRKFEESEYYNSELEKIRGNIDKLQKELNEVHTNLLKYDNHDLNRKYDGYRKWYDVANDLAIELAKYYFFQQYGVGNIENPKGDWYRIPENGTYDNNHIYLEYKAESGKTYKGYFDYIEADDTVHWAKDTPKNVTQIVIMEKKVA